LQHSFVFSITTGMCHHKVIQWTQKKNSKTYKFQNVTSSDLANDYTVPGTKHPKYTALEAEDTWLQVLWIGWRWTHNSPSPKIAEVCWDKQWFPPYHKVPCRFRTCYFEVIQPILQLQLLRFNCNLILNSINWYNVSDIYMNINNFSSKSHLFNFYTQPDNGLTTSYNM
jgi:hypothetical protein